MKMVERIRNSRKIVFLFYHGLEFFLAFFGLYDKIKKSIQCIIKRDRPLIFDYYHDR